MLKGICNKHVSVNSLTDAVITFQLLFSELKLLFFMLIFPSYKKYDICLLKIESTEEDKDRSKTVLSSQHLFLPVLLWYNWYTALYKFKVYSIMIWLNIPQEMVIIVSLLASIILYRYKIKEIEENIFPCDENA